MKDQPRDFFGICASLLKKTHTILKKMFDPAIVVGDKKRVKQKGEQDPDEERLAYLNKTWREMLRDDPWRKKLMTHVTLLMSAMGIFFLMLFLSGLFLPVKHQIFNYIFAGIFATIPYWLWVGGWHKKIEEKVFEAFKKRFGKHFHKK
jgi:hypothetical protein